MTRPAPDQTSSLRELLEAHVHDEGLRPLARRLKLPLGVVRAILDGRDVSGANLQRVAETFGLEFYIGPPRAAHAMRPDNDDPGHEVAMLDRFDLQVSAGAGSVNVAQPLDPIPFSHSWLRRHGLRPADVSVLEVRGDSQEPVLHDGDHIIVDKMSSRPRSGELHVVVRRDSVQVKWVHVLKNAVQLISENPAYPAERVEAHEAPEFYKVRWFSHFIR